MKKVLIISYYWPPCGGIGVLRCLKIAKYLRQFGWEPVIFTAENAHYPSYDETNFKDIPEGVTVLKQPIFEPYRYYKAFTGKAKDANVNAALTTDPDKGSFKHKLSVFIRSNFFIPDARAYWIKPSVKYLKKYLKENPVDALFSDGPPHSNTMIACQLKEQLGIPWLADFQDPWTQVDYFQELILTPWGRKKHHRLEQRAFRNADKMTIVSKRWKKDLESIGAKNVSVIPWGFDEEDYQDLTPNPDSMFTLTHAGLLGDDRNPEALFEAFSILNQEIEGFQENSRIRLIGQVDKLVVAAAEKQGVRQQLQLIEQVDRKTAIQFCANSQVLLLLLNKAANAYGRIPGKLFEYLAVNRPILCLGPQESDVHDILQSRHAGVLEEYRNPQAIARRVKVFYEEFQTTGKVSNTTQGISQYSIKHLTGKIAGMLEDIRKSTSTDQRPVKP
ncbi:glycosyltransferase [Rapidithrix thailandica]|uniref:Glycosyltransferase n=1 Tax=Rapidithrix thailandica TaxID=413964 RepID=A0AAW9RZV1_9BACT